MKENTTIKRAIAFVIATIFLLLAILNFILAVSNNINLLNILFMCSMLFFGLLSSGFMRYAIIGRMIK